MDMSLAQRRSQKTCRCVGLRRLRNVSLAALGADFSAFQSFFSSVFILLTPLLKLLKAFFMVQEVFGLMVYLMLPSTPHYAVPARDPEAKQRETDLKRAALEAEQLASRPILIHFRAPCTLQERRRTQNNGEKRVDWWFGGAAPYVKWARGLQKRLAQGEVRLLQEALGAKLRTRSRQRQLCVALGRGQERGSQELGDCGRAEAERSAKVQSMLDTWS